MIESPSTKGVVSFSQKQGQLVEQNRWGYTEVDDVQVQKLDTKFAIHCLVMSSMGLRVCVSFCFMWSKHNWSIWAKDGKGTRHSKRMTYNEMIWNDDFRRSERMIAITSTWGCITNSADKKWKLVNVIITRHDKTIPSCYYLLLTIYFCRWFSLPSGQLPLPSS